MTQESWTITELRTSHTLKLPLHSLLIFTPFGPFRALLVQPSAQGVLSQLDSVYSEVGRRLGKVSIKILGDPTLCELAKKGLSRHGLTAIRVIPIRNEAQVQILVDSRKVRVESKSLISEVAAPKPHETIESSPARKIRVMVIDDSQVTRKILAHLIESDPTFEVVATAERPSEAAAILGNLRPDVITLDLHMPEKSGTQFYKDTLRALKIPTVIVSALSIEEGTEVLEALEAGAIDYIQKPEKLEMDRITPLLLERLRSASQANIGASDSENTPSPLVEDPQTVSSILPRRDGPPLILIGASTGGTEAIRKTLETLPNDVPPILIVQHIPVGFSRAFADRLNQLCKFTVCEAENGMPVTPGKAYVAPGGKQMRVLPSPKGLRIEVSDAPPVNRHKPSVDYLFRSAARISDHRILALLLTGMGDDGARGLLELRQNGSFTVAQDERSSVVYGMPREAIKMGAALRVLHLKNIPVLITQWIKDPHSRKLAA